MAQIFYFDGVEIHLDRKHVKNVNFTVYPPDGRVRVSAPRRMPEEKLLQVIHAKLPWIKKHRDRIINRKQPRPLKYVSGEPIPFLGEVLHLEIMEHHASPRVELGTNGTITMWVRKGSSREKRENVLTAWYRQQLKERIPAIIARWEPVIGVEISEWGVKRMKTRWGSCSIKARRIWLNLELAKQPVTHLEYIIVHEMVHLLERLHNDRFYAYLDHFMPEWRAYRQALRAASQGSATRID